MANQVVESATKNTHLKEANVSVYDGDLAVDIGTNLAQHFGAPPPRILKDWQK
jgi:hypothetical protein